MINNIYWTQSTESGLCDRLLDLSLMSSYAKIFNSNLILDWKKINWGQEYFWETKENEINNWEKIRYEDYLLENLRKYLKLPSNIIFDTKVKYINTFQNYLGGIHSPFSFYNSFLTRKVSLDFFLNVFNETLMEFIPTDYSNKMFLEMDYPDLSVHIRRKDKIRKHTDFGSLEFNQLDDLNLITTQSIDIFLEKNDSKKIFLCSDDNDELQKFKSRYSDRLIKTPNFDDLVMKTYFDLILLSKSSNIIMSQKHSNFSLFGSLLGKVNLYYLYNDCMITRNGFNKLPFIKHFSKI